MAEKNIVEFIREWQTGFFLIIGTLLASVGSAIILKPLIPFGVLIGGISGAIIGFLTISYILYGDQ